MQGVSTSAGLLLTVTLFVACADTAGTQAAHVQPETIIFSRTYLKQLRQIPLEFKLGDEIIWDARLTLVPQNHPGDAFTLAPSGPLHTPAVLQYAPREVNLDLARIVIEWKNKTYFVEVSGQAVAVPECVPPDNCTEASFDVETEACVYQMANDGFWCGDAVTSALGFCEAGQCVTVPGMKWPLERCDANPESEITLNPAWSFPINVSGRVAVDEVGNLYFFSSKDKGPFCEVTSLDLNGHLRWQTSDSLDCYQATLSLSEGLVVLTTPLDLEVRSAGDGTLVWNAPVSDPGTAALDAILAPGVLLGRETTPNATRLLARELSTGRILHTLEVPSFSTGDALVSTGSISDGRGRAFVSLAGTGSDFLLHGIDLALDESLQVQWFQTHATNDNVSWDPMLLVEDTYWSRGKEVVGTSYGERRGTLPWSGYGQLRTAPITGGNGTVSHAVREFPGKVPNCISLSCNENVLYTTDVASRRIVNACMLENDTPLPSLLATTQGVAILNFDEKTWRHPSVLLWRNQGLPSLLAHLLPDDNGPDPNTGVAAFGNRVFVHFYGNRLAAYDVPGLELATKGWISDRGNLSRTSTPAH